VPADAEDATMLEGKEVRQRFRGANFFPNLALDHHHYLNVGYMVICLSNIAMLHYSFQRAGRPRPQTLYRRSADLWQVVQRMIFADGRLCRVGGDSRVRYCYCQDYLIPVLI